MGTMKNLQIPIILNGEKREWLFMILGVSIAVIYSWLRKMII